MVIHVETRLPHLARPNGKRSLHARVLVDQRILRVVVARFELIRLEYLCDSRSGATARAREIFGFQCDGEGRIDVLTEQGVIVCDLIGGGEGTEDFDIALAEANPGRAVAGVQLRRQTRIKSRDTKTMTTDEVFLAETWEVFIRGHAGAYRVVVRSDVREALIAHAAHDQCLGGLDCLNQLTGRKAKLLRAKPWWRLRLGHCHGRGEKDGNEADKDPLVHGGILSTADR